MIINGVEIDFSITNVDNLKALQKGAKELLEKINKVSFTDIDDLIMYCEDAKIFFDSVLGEENRKKVFGECKDYEQILSGMHQILKIQNNIISSINEKYTTNLLS